VLCGAQTDPQSEDDVLTGLKSAGFTPGRSLDFAGIQVTEYLATGSSTSP